MKVIQTRYNNRYYRSRTEARWAVFFDAIGINYEYEPEGFMLNDGSLYLPDFYFPDQKMYGEVKPDGYNPESDIRHQKFVEEGDVRLVFFIGAPGKRSQVIFELIDSTNTPDPPTRDFFDHTGIAFGDFIFGKYDEFLYTWSDEYEPKTSISERAIRLSIEARFDKDQKIPKPIRAFLVLEAKHWTKALYRNQKKINPDVEWGYRPPCPDCGASTDKAIIQSIYNPAKLYCQSCEIEYDFDRNGLKV